MASLDTVDCQYRTAVDRRGPERDSRRTSIWVVNVYQIAMVATLLPLAALGEIIGHQRIYLGGPDPVHARLGRLRAGVVAADAADRPQRCRALAPPAS